MRGIFLAFPNPFPCLFFDFPPLRYFGNRTQSLLALIKRRRAEIAG